ncbi:hypothetical protein HYU21_00370 [Candidatus Woesearchaeota archaeon]|nr:hypothetical protein [Candidatus Woesearchaeota archaeon]
MTCDKHTALKNLTIDDYVIIAQIYGGGTRVELLSKAESLEAETKLIGLELNLTYYMRNTLQVPRGLEREVLEYGRKFSDLEVEALYLRQKVDKAGVSSISIALDH